MDHTEKSLVALSLCTGMRGLDRGLERGIAALRNPYGYQNFEEWRDACDRAVEYAAHVEIESFVALNLAQQMEQGVLAPVPIWTDLKTFPWEQFYNKVHILTGGYPCQPFSQAGLQKGVDDPRHLFPFIEHGIDATRPVLCFFENVANHLNLGYSEVRRRISSLGYKVEADIFAAENVGAPHIRKRLFIMAVADTYCNESSKRRGDLKEMLGFPKGEREPKYGAAVSGGDRSKVVDAARISQRESSNKHDSFADGRWARDESGNRGNDVDNAAGGRHAAQDAIPARRDGAAGTGAPMDDSINARLERHGWHGHGRSRWQNTVRSVAATSIWPAGQGEYQHDWEEPRLISKLGMRVNGYSYHEDLLRLLGNAVVEQQAELAFRTLIQKFI